ncbi:B-cell lymphoma/leukemia 10-like [Dendronephthya gigantea]|uniref:B-cell lymphoma/leukemia 10-like n=1 Tax=Dendronephthya gigantea TaxID=151771 RepID=UPI00106B5C71|nr:B-cell lymphoma/leukemia 10-like [Dendronephthya gigantea]
MVNREIKFQVLEKLRESLVQDMQPEKHFDFLRSKTVLDEEDCEEITAKTTRRKKAGLLLDILMTKGENAFDYFCESFIVCGRTQLHLLNLILDAYEEQISENEVESFARTQEEFFNKDILNEQLPQPGEPGAPCLPSQVMPYLIMSEPPTEMNASMIPSYEDITPPPPYST